MEVGEGGHSESGNFGVVLPLTWYGEKGPTYAREDSAICYIKSSLLA
jgi:hypothetical protein